MTNSQLGLIILNIEDRTSVKKYATLNTNPNGRAYALDLKDDETVVVGTLDYNTGIYIFNIEDPYNPY